MALICALRENVNIIFTHAQLSKQMHHDTREQNSVKVYLESQVRLFYDKKCRCDAPFFIYEVSTPVY